MDFNDFCFKQRYPHTLFWFLWRVSRELAGNFFPPTWPWVTLILFQISKELHIFVASWSHSSSELIEWIPRGFITLQLVKVWSYKLRAFIPSPFYFSFSGSIFISAEVYGCLWCGETQTNSLLRLDYLDYTIGKWMKCENNRSYLSLQNLESY